VVGGVHTCNPFRLTHTCFPPSVFMLLAPTRQNKTASDTPAVDCQTTYSSCMASAAHSCLACRATADSLQRCGRCKNAWFCNRDCQVVARKKGHKGANCRPAEGAQTPDKSKAATDQLLRRHYDLMDEAFAARRTNSRIGLLATVEKLREAASVADEVGGARGAALRAEADQHLASMLVRLGDLPAAAQLVCSALQAARSTGCRTQLVSVLIRCGTVARDAPNEMVSAEIESRKHDKLGSERLGGFDLSQEGRISLPTNPAALSRLSLAYNEAAVATCDRALANVGGRGSPAAANEHCVPLLGAEARARGSLGLCLFKLGDDRQRSLDILRQAVALTREVLRTAPSSAQAGEAQRTLAGELCNLGSCLNGPGMAGCDSLEAETCLREALQLVEATNDVDLKQTVLRNMVNMSGRLAQPVEPAELEALRARMNQLYAGTGRSTETTCTICLEPLQQTGDGAGKGAEQSGGGGASRDAFLSVLRCGHQFHWGCLSSWARMQSNPNAEVACPVCKKMAPIVYEAGR